MTQTGVESDADGCTGLDEQWFLQMGCMVFADGDRMCMHKAEAEFCLRIPHKISDTPYAQTPLHKELLESETVTLEYGSPLLQREFPQLSPRKS